MYHRLFRSSDFGACVPLLHPGFTISARRRSALPALWRRLYLTGQLHGGVVVDPDLPTSDSIVAFGLSVFLTEAFVNEYLAAPTPYVSALVYERILADRAPILRPRDVPGANATAALNLLILHFGMRPSAAGDGRAHAIASIAQEGFRLCHVGYGLARVLQEAYGDAQLPFFTAGGFLLKSEFGACVTERGHEPGPDERPYLMGLYRSDPASRYPGSGISDLFQHVPPKFYFSAAEQRVLLRAMTDESDETIADTVGISYDAVKKAWRRIHDRVATVAPDLVGDVHDGDGTRGKERRRRLLQYLRYHLEELRPFERRTPTR